MRRPGHYAGILTRGEDGTLHATLEDSLGFTLILTGVRDGSAYALTAVPGAVPECWALPTDGMGE